MKKKGLSKSSRVFFEAKLFEYWRFLHNDYQLLPYEYDKVREEAKIIGVSIDSSIKKLGPKKLEFPRNKLLMISESKDARKYIASLSDDKLDLNLGTICEIRNSWEYKNAKTVYRRYKDAIRRKELRLKKTK